MKKKKKKTNNKNRILSIVICLIIVVGVYFGYKGILLYNINSTNEVINNYLKLRNKTSFDETIEISYVEPSDSFEFEDIRMINFLDDYEKEENVYTNGDNTFRIVKSKGLLKDLNLKGLEEYLKKYNINNDEDIYEFMLKFKKHDVNILSTYGKLKDELFRRNFLVITSTTFDEFHLLKGDITGYMIISNNVTCTIKNGNDYYELYFYNYDDIDNILDIISTISFEK